MFFSVDGGTAVRASELLDLLPSLESNVSHAEHLSGLMWHMIGHRNLRPDEEERLWPLMDYLDWLCEDLKGTVDLLYGFAWGESMLQTADRHAKIKAEVKAAEAAGGAP